MNYNLKPVRVQDPFLAQALDEHEQMHKTAVGVQRLLADKLAAEATAEDVKQALDLIHKECNGLAQHFAREEEGGYLEEAVNRVPSLATQAAALLKEHTELLRLARKIIAEAQESPDSTTAWQTLQRGCRQYYKKLLAHEDAENALLERGFNEDLRLQ